MGKGERVTMRVNDLPLDAICALVVTAYAMGAEAAVAEGRTADHAARELERVSADNDRLRALLDGSQGVARQQAGEIAHLLVERDRLYAAIRAVRQAAVPDGGRGVVLDVGAYLALVACLPADEHALGAATRSAPLGSANVTVDMGATQGYGTTSDGLDHTAHYAHGDAGSGAAKEGAE